MYMKKIHFLVLVETILLMLALMDILSDNWTRVLLILVLVLLFFHYYRESDTRNAFLIALLIFIFLGSMMNPFIIAGVIFAVVYAFIAVIPYLYRERGEKELRFQSKLKPERKRMKWLGDLDHLEEDSVQFDDILINRLSGRDTIHLDQVILHGHDNVIVIRKVLGDTRIILPVDVAIKLKVATVYGNVTLPGEPIYRLRNEELSLVSPDFEQSNRSVKILLSGCLGNVEVIRQ